MKMKTVSTLAFIGGLVLSAAAPFSVRATLTYENDYGVGFIYDSVENVTWTQDADLSGSVTLDYPDAQTWAATLSVGGVGASNWMLPSATQFTSLYDQLDGVNNQDKFGPQVFFGPGPNDYAANVAPEYWTSADSTDFNFYYGYPGYRDDTANSFPVWAVTSGEPVPEPSTIAFGLLAAGMAGCQWRARLKSGK